MFRGFRRKEWIESLAERYNDRIGKGKGEGSSLSVGGSDTRPW